MHDIINNISTWSILKWVIIVLVAGFIGQFGKSMAQAIMAKIRLARAEKHEVKDTGLHRTTPPETEAPDSVINNHRVTPTVVKSETQDKKTLKIQAKKDKKAAKLAKKG